MTQTAFYKRFYVDVHEINFFLISEFPLVGWEGKFK